LSPVILEEVKGVGPKTAEQIASCKADLVAGDERKKAEKDGVRLITLLSDDYPRNLRYSYRPPPVLYVAGTIKAEDILSVAVVGTRNCSPYGRIATERMVRPLVEKGFTIVSGFARGVDTIAHRISLEDGGRTIAILGSGIDIIYPPENRNIFEKITQNGAVVSQFAYGTEPDKRNFPMRNRIISSLSLGTIVIEAGEKSGALITAYASLEEGREVFAVPGRIDSSISAGTNRLIQKGAKLVMTAEDVIEEFSPEIQNLMSLESEDKKGAAEDTSLEKDEKTILGYLEGCERNIDYLIENTDLPAGVLLGTLLEMELKGLIRQLPGRLFIKL